MYTSATLDGLDPSQGFNPEVDIVFQAFALRNRAEEVSNSVDNRSIDMRAPQQLFE
jgi:hypothetical protein